MHHQRLKDIQSQYAGFPEKFLLSSRQTVVFSFYFRFRRLWTENFSLLNHFLVHLYLPHLLFWVDKKCDLTLWFPSATWKDWRKITAEGKTHRQKRKSETSGESIGVIRLTALRLSSLLFFFWFLLRDVATVNHYLHMNFCRHHAPLLFSIFLLERDRNSFMKISSPPGNMLS